MSEARRRVGGMAEAELRRSWRRLVEQRLPAAARPDWPVHQDHCFARILLDAAAGRPWREAFPAPAWRNAPLPVLARAASLGEAVLRGEADLAALNQRSLALRRGARHHQDAAPLPLLAWAERG